MQVEGYSLDGQKTSLKKFAEREEMQIVGIYEDAGKSGKSIEGRPAFKRMLSDIQEGLDVDYVLVYKLSRFGRNAADILNSLEFIQSYGVNLICIEEGIDSSQTSGKLLISVLSAVAEIERENILEQTMNGRREKARQGKWNGGPAPYGYILKDDTLLIDEQEAEIVRTIFDKFVNTNMGYTGIAKYLNLQGIKKTPRKKTDIEEFSAHFIKILLDNPVYCGKIAYGRRTREKVKGTKADYKVVNKQDYCLVDGLHEGIIDEELWYKAHDKREATGVKSVSKYGKDRAHLLTGIIKCPKCGSGMYANRVCWTKKDGTYKEVMYYACSRNKQERGHYCDYSANLKKTDIEPLVIEFIKDLVQDEHFAIEIKKKIGLQVDTTKIDTEISNYESKLKEVELNKARLEREIDSLPIDTTHRERKLHDMTLRLDALYDTIAEIEEKVEDAKLRRKSVEAEFITMENIYKILQHFGELYDIISDEEKKELIATLVKEIQIYPEGESDTPLKSMKFNFPVYKDGQEVNEIFLDKQTNVETLIKIGRAHTAGDFFDKYALAKKYGFDINVDLIAGLNDETTEDFARTLDAVKTLRPENITVHTLSRKNGSQLKQDGKYDNSEISKMTDYALTALSAAGYIPYYLYRQKQMLGNLENVGYSLPGKQCVNNVTTMEDCMSVIACGAGAITKAVDLSRGKIVRFASLRDSALYIERFDEKAEEKRNFLQKQFTNA